MVAEPAEAEEAASDAPEESTAIASIVDNMLAELRPKLVEEIAKKMGMSIKGVKYHKTIISNTVLPPQEGVNPLNAGPRRERPQDSPPHLVGLEQLHAVSVRRVPER